MSGEPKIRRQGKGQPKARFQIWLATVNKEALKQLAINRGTSMSRVINEWLQEMRGQSST